MTDDRSAYLDVVLLPMYEGAGWSQIRDAARRLVFRTQRGVPRRKWTGAAPRICLGPGGHDELVRGVEYPDFWQWWRTARWDP